jgi:hypothetical protein
LKPKAKAAGPEHRKWLLETDGVRTDASPKCFIGGVF